MSIVFKAITTENGKGIFHLFPALCKGCGLCIEKCPVDTIGWAKQLGAFGTPVVEPGHGKPCIACKKCQLVCPDAAIWIERRDGKGRDTSLTAAPEKHIKHK
ncbi:4Fe-4S binding domain protein [Neomoorella glycerini]|uniref:4Fe-4S binding domain protein n=1 Tax=Neomoorella glycerini TaxID=55779 RepID=A0A6I5ZQB2_9FIRM|nr:4Fe-4S dicluster domain-containing protein [Moorella glycerini]QGP91998.1 4Fe-4S binding domain protein [Moorella glycerini]